MSKYYSNIRIAEDVYIDLLPVFLEELSEETRKLKAISPGEKTNETRNIAHKIKGMALSFGAEGLATCAECVELSIINEDLAALEDLMNKLVKQLDLAFVKAEEEFQLSFPNKTE
jgi:HPt (histidine-containing phosphotransfer) domain-containing protein